MARSKVCQESIHHEDLTQFSGNHRSSAEITEPQSRILLRGENALLGVDLQNYVHNLAIVELAHGFRVALLPLELGIHLVVDIGRECREAIVAVIADDVGLDISRASIGQIHDRAGKRRILAIENLSREQASGLIFVLIRWGSNSRQTEQKQQQSRNRRLFHGYPPVQELYYFRCRLMSLRSSFSMWTVTSEPGCKPL